MKDCRKLKAKKESEGTVSHEDVGGVVLTMIDIQEKQVDCCHCMPVEHIESHCPKREKHREENMPIEKHRKEHKAIDWSHLWASICESESDEDSLFGGSDEEDSLFGGSIGSIDEEVIEIVFGEGIGDTMAAQVEWESNGKLNKIEWESHSLNKSNTDVDGRGEVQMGSIALAKQDSAKNVASYVTDTNEAYVACASLSPSKIHKNEPLSMERLPKYETRRTRKI